MSDEISHEDRTIARAMRLAASVKAERLKNNPNGSDDEEHGLEKTPERRPRRDFSDVTDERVRRAMERSEAIRIRKEQEAQHTHHMTRSKGMDWER